MKMRFWSPPVLFLAFLLLLCSTVILLQRPNSQVDLFAAIPDAARVSFGPMTADEMFDAKLTHAKLNPRYTAGIFGNSRSLMLGREDGLSTELQPFFNFSVGGQSLRTSAYLLENLSAMGKAPEIALVSFDHSELQFYQNPDIGGPWTRALLAWRDLREAGAVPPKEMLKMMWRHAYSAYKALERTFDFEQVLIGLSWYGDLAGRDDPWLAAISPRQGIGYRCDGSRAQVLKTAPEKLPLMRPAPPAVLPHYLNYDLRRLAAIRDTGVRVIVFESLLDPENGVHFAATPSPQAAAARRAFVETCAEFTLECHPLDPTRIPASITAWDDTNHAPAAVLGAYVRGLLTTGRRNAAQ